MPKQPKEITLSDAHAEFAERSHLLRWFHERTTKELKAMKKALAALQAGKGGPK